MKQYRMVVPNETDRVLSVAANEPRFVALGTGLLETIEQSTYDGTTIRVLLHLALTTDSSQAIKFLHRDIAARLKIGRPMISKSFKRLAADDLIYKTGNTWFLNLQREFTETGEWYYDVSVPPRTEVRARTSLRVVRSTAVIA